MTRRRVRLSLAALCAAAAFPAVSAAAVPTGIVVSESGTGLSVVRASDSSTTRLRTGGKVYVGDMLLVGPGVTAVLKLTVPPGRSPDDTLVSLRAVGGGHPNVRMERRPGYVLVTIGR